MPRFVPIENNPEYPADEFTRWYWDTERPLFPGPYIAVQCYADRDPNAFVKLEKMWLLFTDQAEYYCVCLDCFAMHRYGQWSGSTRGGPNWRKNAEDYLERHIEQKGWCEFCDPCFGNGGWM